MISLNKFSLGILNDTKSYALKLKAIESNEYSALDLNEIIDVDFPDDQYIKEQTKKNQICLHHTVSGPGVDGDISWWKQTPERIGTAVIVDRDGKIFQMFSSDYWAFHLGTKGLNDTTLNKGSIGIEIDSWGGLVKAINNSWYPATWDNVAKKNVPNMKVNPIKNVQEYPQGFMGFYGFEKYTDAQIDSVRKLLDYWCDKHNIPQTYNSDMWALSNRALSGTAGIWTHVSYRGNQKSDCHPMPELINMLKAL